MFRVLRDKMCSNRWAKPDRPSGSCFDPTSYQTDTETFGVVVSRIEITRRPLASRRSLYWSGGTSIAPAAGAAEHAASMPANPAAAVTASSAAFIAVPKLIACSPRNPIATEG